jgi:hypothetical protein
MSRSGLLEGAAWEEGERKKWSPSGKLIVAFIIGVLALSPAILGIYWEIFMTN